MDFLSFVPSLSPLTTLVLVLTIVYLVYSRLRIRHPSEYPPMPLPPHPIFGHLKMLGNEFPNTLAEWRKTTGGIFSIYFGHQIFVVFSNYNILKEALVKNGDHFSDRGMSPLSLLRKDGGYGVLTSEGANWKAQRSASLSILRDFGMGKNWLGEKISEEVDNYVKEMSKFVGKPTEIRKMTNIAVANVICAIVIGKRFEYTDPFMNDYMESINKLVVLAHKLTIFIVRAFPWIRYLPVPGDPFSIKKVTEIDQQHVDFCEHAIQKSRENSEENNFINAYFKEQDKDVDSGKSTHLTDRNLRRLIDDLINAGSETTSTTLLWAYVFSMHYPHIQEKVYDEIVTVVGTERSPSLQDRTKLKYFNAFILETQRLGSIVPLSIIHYCNETTRIAGYTVPKGAFIFPNLDAVLRDETTWGDPMVFRPERFLDEEGNIVIPEQFVPFSLGRRVCLGESLAKMELFLFLSAIFQRFQICPEDPKNLPSLQRVFGTTAAPVPFKLVLKER